MTKLTRSIEGAANNTLMGKAAPAVLPVGPRSRLLLSVGFEPGGVNVEYIDTADVKQIGMRLTKQLHVPYASDYDDEIDAVLEAVHALLIDALEDFPRLEELPDREEDEEDDE